MSRERKQPHSLEAERSVLGSLLIENDGYDKISSQLETKDFFRDAHQKIFEAIGTLLGDGKPADLRLVCEELIRRRLLDDVGGATYVSELVDGVPRAVNIKYYAGIVREKSAMRRLIKIGSRLVEQAYVGEDGPQALIQHTDVALTALSSDAKWNTGAVPICDSMGALADELARRIERRGQINGVSSGLPSLDLLTHGWQPRKMVVVAADTSFGKSVFAIDQAIAFARAGQRVVYYSLEMPKEDLHWRMLSSLSGIPLNQMTWGNITTDAQFRAIANAQEAMADLPIEINDTVRSIHDMRSECRQIKAERGLGAVVIDHFQLMDGVEGENRTQQLANISRRTQTLASELGVTLFVLSQLTLTEQTTGEPQLGHLRECKSLGHDADQVLMLDPHDKAKARTEQPVITMKLLMRKNRGGSLGRVWVDLERDYVRFVEGSEPVRAEPVAKRPKPVGKFAFGR